MMDDKSKFLKVDQKQAETKLSQPRQSPQPKERSYTSLT